MKKNKCDFLKGKLHTLIQLIVFLAFFYKFIKHFIQNESYSK